MQIKLNIDLKPETFHKLQEMRKAYEKSHQTVLSFPGYVAIILEGVVKIRGSS